MTLPTETASLSPETIQDWTRQHVLVSWAAQRNLSPIPIVEAHGSTLIGADGSRYLDFSSGLINVNLGHGHPRVVRAIQEQAARLCYVTPSFGSDSRAALAKALYEVSPGRALTKTLFTTGGAEANESAIKIARLVTGRHKILTAYRSYHGATYGAATAGGDNRRWAVEPGISGVVRFFAPYPYRSPFGAPAEGETAAALRHLEDIIGYEGAQYIAALLIEPVVGTNGVIVYPDGYLQGVRELCNRHGILLIFDEVMTGFGRTGRFWASENWHVVPDMTVFAKGVTSGYVPLGGVSVSAKMAEYFDDHTLWTGLTYSGHPLACAAGTAAVAAYQDDGLIERSRAMGGILGDRLQRLRERHPSVGDVRGLGLFWALELVKDRATREMLVPWNAPGQGVTAEITRDLMKRGVYVYGRWNVLFIAPPLIITESEIEQATSALDRALEIADKAAA
ncbi:MAG: aminotransferase class III-fold pyridoxal phosphate-dependent enzyme [Armatimonadota bacterium]|nr:aminotransferase class III-fold pyridoxal phosphate-dependent enzyme [Armatimonadota bacterium]